jgi:hypothetical protein
MPPIDGSWKVRYSLKQESPFGSEEGEPDEVGKIVLKNGALSGHDPWGYAYVGFYSVVDGR